MTSSSQTPVAIVTGAGSGIGLETARLLAREGWSVVLAGRRASQLEEGAATLMPGSHLCVPTDVADAGACGSLVAKTMETFGRIDALVNNAGFAPLIPLGKQTPELIRQTFEINTLGPANLILGVWPHMVAKKSGRVVNVSSIATVDPFPGFFGYAAAKAGVELMAKSIAKEGASAGIKGFAVAPGAVETGMLRSIISEKMVPTSKTLAPETVAQIVVDCVLGRRDAENGKTILVPSP